MSSLNLPRVPGVSLPCFPGEDVRVVPVSRALICTKKDLVPANTDIRLLSLWAEPLVAGSEERQLYLQATLSVKP